MKMTSMKFFLRRLSVKSVSVTDLFWPRKIFNRCKNDLLHQFFYFQEFKLTIHVEHVDELPEVDGQNDLDFRISGQEQAEATISSQAEEVAVGKKRALSEKTGNEPAAKVQKISTYRNSHFTQSFY